MVSQDFVTAVKYELPVKVVILNNKSIGMIKYEQQQMGHQTYQTDLGEMDFAKFAEACGGEGYRVEKYEELESSMRRAFASDKPAIIDVVIKEQAPLPGHINYTQAVNYSKFLIKEFFDSGKIELPDMKKAIDRLF
ncbi:pyruvate oxidase [Thalassobacillus cyri]|uniref:Pyruvate oxidase n=1 Tax=Thalassobacillus cyri TaxID=571932 RepID=A0A1H4GNT5_9BACI|nr:pyruvate oxidase [Thalassobacillus cyri]